LESPTGGVRERGRRVNFLRRNITGLEGEVRRDGIDEQKLRNGIDDQLLQ